MCTHCIVYYHALMSSTLSFVFTSEDAVEEVAVATQHLSVASPAPAPASPAAAGHSPAPRASPAKKIEKFGVQTEKGKVIMCFRNGDKVFCPGKASRKRRQANFSRQRTLLFLFFFALLALGQQTHAHPSAAPLYLFCNIAPAAWLLCNYFSLPSSRHLIAFFKH